MCYNGVWLFYMQGCDEKLRAELIEARVAPLRVQAAQKAQVSKQAQETAYR